MTDACADAAALKADPALAALCSCAESTAALTEATDLYKLQLDKYNNDLIEYRNFEAYDACLKNGSCINYDTIYNTTYQAKYNEYKNAVRGMYGCFLDSNRYTSNDYCEDDAGPGWIYTYNRNEAVSQPPCDKQPTTSCSACDLNQRRGYCKRSSSQLKTDWSEHFVETAKRPSVSTQPQPPSFNPQVAISCCSQTLTDFEAEKITIEDISQQCSAEINNNINKYETDGTIPPTLPVNDPEPDNPKEPEVPEGLKIFEIVLIVVAILVFIAMMIWVGIKLRKRSSASTSV